MSDDITGPVVGIPMPIREPRKVPQRTYIAAKPGGPVKGRPPTYPPSQGYNPRDHEYGAKTGREGTLSTVPDAPCFKCGAARWCDHRKPDQ